MHRKYKDYAGIFEEMFNPTGKYKAALEEFLNNRPLEDTAIADYVWLLIAFEDDKVIIKWQDEWKIEDYE